MPEMDGLQATPKIIEASPNSRVIILTSFGEEERSCPPSAPGHRAICSRIFRQPNWYRRCGRHTMGRCNCIPRSPGN